MKTAEQYWQDKNGGKPSNEATNEDITITPIFAVSLMNDYHRKVLKAELRAYDRWMGETDWGGEYPSIEKAVNKYLEYRDKKLKYKQ